VSGLYRNVTLNDNEFCVGGSGTAILYILGVEEEAYASEAAQCPFFATLGAPGDSRFSGGGKA